MKIGFMGTKFRMELVQKTINTWFPEIQAEICVEEGYIYSQKTADFLIKLRERVDGMIFGGELQYEIYQDIFKGIIPCTHIRKDASCLANALLILSQKGVDVTRVSIDNYSYSTIQRVMDDMEVKQHQIVMLHRRAFRSNGAEYYEDLIAQHRQLYETGTVSGCVTTLSFVYERLCQEGIPASYMRPTTEVIIRAVHRLKEMDAEKKEKQDGSLAVLILRLTPEETVSYQNHNEYLDSHEKLKAAEEIHYFAQSAKATVITQSDDEFTIIINRSDLMECTNELQSFPMLHFIRDNSKCDFSLGIGFGDKPWDARMNAVMALKKACQVPKCGTYIIYNNQSVIGPVEFVNQYTGGMVYEREQLAGLSQETGLSEDKLARIYNMMKKHKKNCFTVQEMANALQISRRSANRIMGCLEEAGYAREAGRSNQGKVGRPENVFELNLKLES